ncbi:MAG TPA: hypothetical protein VNZ45_04460, partial [Bacteroidia bacterium]|nr:hypothetical protein [Bacteroidia bacterium]
KLTKLHKLAQVKAYQDAIKIYNDNIQEEAEKNLSLSAGIEYKTMSGIIGMSASSRKGYSYLVYDRAVQFAGKNGPVENDFIFYADKQNDLQAMADNYNEAMQFESADPKYSGEEDYRKLEIIVKGKKIAFTQSLDMILPTRGSLALCLEELQIQFNNAITGDKKISKNDAKQEVRSQVAKARRKRLLICKDNLEKNITDAKIQPAYLYKFKIVSREEFDKAIIDKDTSCCILLVYPADKTQGGYKPTVNYQHLIIDVETDDILLTVSPEPSGAAVVPSYQKLTDKHFKDILKAEDEVTK